MRYLQRVLTAAMLMTFAGVGVPQTMANEPAAGATYVARWKDDKKAAVLLMFDDSMPSHVKSVVPALKKHGFVGTFYVNPGKGEWKAFKDAWEKDIPATGMEYGNHTMTHKGAKDVANLEDEIRQSNEVITQVIPGKKPRLISWGTPGVAKGAWNVTEKELAETLPKYQLIERGPFHGHGAAIHFKTAADVMRGVEKAVKEGGTEYVIFHGVGGEWISFPLPEFTALVDQLAAQKDVLWVAGHIAAHKYQTERDSATVKVVAASDKQIKLELTSKADAALYDAPLTLVTRTPAGWKGCRVSQGNQTATATVNAGTARFDAIPGGGPITLEPTDYK